MSRFQDNYGKRSPVALMGAANLLVVPAYTVEVAGEW